MSPPAASPELLAPAGDWDALRAACANGADAVYFGLSAFNARHRAANFTPDELPKVIDFLHARNVRGFVTLNTLIFSDELEEVARYVRLIAEAGADAVIVQDLGVARLIGRLAPGLHVHASTQMTLTEPRGVEWARDRLNIRRAVLARELSVADVRKVAEQSRVPLEVFVHGALCVAYSGQCLTSEALGGRSANRGQCAQACRLPYEMVVDGAVRDLGDRAYLLSPQDLAAHEFVGELADAGVVSFKIEGRLKGPHYVAAATRAYREAIDAAAARRPFALPPGEARDLQQTFSRGFTPGFLEGPNHQRLVAGRFPKSRGLYVGKVAGVSRRGVRVELADASVLAAGDGVMFDLGRPEEKEPGGRVWEVRSHPAARGAQVELVFEAGALDLTAIRIEARVWKTDDPAMRRRLEHTYVGDPVARRAAVWMTVAGELGGPLRLTVRVADGREATAEWLGPVEKARKHPLTTDALREQLGRLGDTPFELTDVDNRLPADAMVPRSVLNDLRRQAVGELLAARETHGRVAVVEPDALERLRAEIGSRGQTTGLSNLARGGTACDRPEVCPHGSAPASLTVLVRTLDQLDAVLPHRPAMVYCDFEDVRRYKEAVPRARAAGVPVGLATLRILKPGEEGFLKPLLQAEPDAVLVRNLASMLYFREHLADAAQVGDFSLNVANELTADLLMREGFARLVPGYDLSWEQFAALVRRSDPAWYEPVIHQHMPMFYDEFCIFAAYLSKGKDWRDCGRPCDRHKVDLKDRTGALFPVTADAGCRNTVFNALAQSGAEYVGRMLELGIRRFRIDLLRGTPEQVGPLIETYRRVIDGTDSGRDTWRKLRAMNQLGVTRGTLQLV
jgi:putative protease